MTSLAAPMTRILAEGAAVAGKCNGRTCGWTAVFAVALMFAALAGGVFMLLQSNFGVVQGYLISATAFWLSWFVLALIWFTGVPNVRINYIPGIKKEIPRSTPRNMGPQGKLPTWHEATADEQARLRDDANFVPSAGTKKASDLDAIKSAETAASEAIAAHYATELGTQPSKVTVPGTVLVDEQATEILRSGGGGIKYVRFTSKAAPAGGTASEEEKALIPKIKPATFTLKLDQGTEALQTRIALPLTFVVFLLHLLGLMAYERKHQPVTAVAREREREAAGV